jgi:drug/metabolite transporter (DMT)-like permease
VFVKSTLLSVLGMALLLGFRALMNRLERGGERARQAYIVLWMAFGVVMLVVYAVMFRNITFPPPSVLHGLALLLVLALPVGLIVLGVLELRAMRRPPRHDGSP